MKAVADRILDSHYVLSVAEQIRQPKIDIPPGGVILHLDFFRCVTLSYEEWYEKIGTEF